MPPKTEKGSKSPKKKAWKKPKDIKMPIIIVDSREKTPHKFKTTDTCEGYRIEKLDTGDYSLAGLEEYVIIERKNSIDELVTCFGTDRRRFMDELDRLEEVPHRFIIVEDSIETVFGRKRFSRMNPKCFLSNVFSVVVKRGIPVFFCATRQEAHVTIKWLLYKAYEKYLEESSQWEE